MVNFGIMNYTLVPVVIVLTYFTCLIYKKKNPYNCYPDCAKAPFYVHFIKTHKTFWIVF